MEVSIREMVQALDYHAECVGLSRDVYCLYRDRIFWKLHDSPRFFWRRQACLPSLAHNCQEAETFVDTVNIRYPSKISRIHNT